ncbi:MAG TPA: lipopolysaccharide biosynthesis protein [Sedimentisphaerales bacterium]|nr:lipopolysaccharide biosynthesis protein [Sedimentisphaerales bacterium]
MDLKKKTIKAIIWSLIERSGQLGTRLIISIILARLLLPPQFGLIGMLTIFMAIAQLFLNSGFGLALIQKKDATHVDSCSIFYFNIFVGIIVAGLLCLAAPWIAAFYEEPALTSLTQFLSLNLIIGSFALVQTALLVKHIDFKTQLKINMVATIASGIIGITLAYRGFGVWSLAIQSVTNTLFGTVLLWFFNKWRPSLVFSFVALKRMFNFSWRFLISGLIDTVFRNIYFIVIGKIFTATDLGFYSKAQNWQRLPSESLTGGVSRVTFPVFSSIQDDAARLKKGVRKALTNLAFLNFPMMIGIIVLAKPLVLVLLTEKWLPCVPYLQLVCVVGLFYPLHAINVNVLMAKGRSDLFLRLEILKKTLIVLNILVTYRWGIQAMLWGQIVGSLIAYYLNTYYTGRLIAYPFKEQVIDLFLYLGMAVVMGVCVYSLRLFPFPNNWSLLISQVLAGVVVYGAMNLIFKMPEFIEIFSLLNDIAKSRMSRFAFLK